MLGDEISSMKNDLHYLELHIKNNVKAGVEECVLPE